jgi:tetratricopeptide (TPR) repeat protein
MINLENIFICQIAWNFKLKDEFNTIQLEEIKNFDNLWDYSNPNASRQQFENLLIQVNSIKSAQKEMKDLALQIETQIARTYSLELNVEMAKKILEKVKTNLNDELLRTLATIRFHLELGRTYNTEKNVEEAMKCFQEAFNLAEKMKQDYYAVDALHMMAILSPLKDSIKYSNLALNIIDRSSDHKTTKWLGPLLNNTGWSYFDSTKYDMALELFKRCEEYHYKNSNDRELRIAKWSVARVLRQIESIHKALKIQIALEAENDKNGEPDGYVFEELGELYLILDDKEKSKFYFSKAYKLLSKDLWLQKNESERLNRMKKLS